MMGTAPAMLAGVEHGMGAPVTATAATLETMTTHRLGVERKVAEIVLWRYSPVMKHDPEASGKSRVICWTMPAL